MHTVVDALGPEWVMQSARSEDVERIAQFNEQIFRPSIGVWTRTLLTGNHPTVSASDFVLIENSFTGEIAASLALVTQKWLFEGIPINVAQIELVGTAVEYRGRGLVRKEMIWFDHKAKEKKCLLGCVQGVPTLYKKLGYHFAIDLKVGAMLWLDQMPGATTNGGCKVRAASLGDVVDLVNLHNANLQHLAIRSEMNEALWTYQELQPPDSEHACETYVLESADGIDGYMRLGRYLRLGRLVVRELVCKTYDDMIKALHFAGQLAREQELPSILLRMQMSHPAVQIVRSWGAQNLEPYAWQVHVFDWLAFFDLILPVLERRLAGTLLYNTSRELLIEIADEGNGLYLRLHRGRVAAIELVSGREIWHLSVTRPLLTALVMGYRTRAELETQHIEMKSDPSSRYLIDILFPRRPAYVYETY